MSREQDDDDFVIRYTEHDALVQAFVGGRPGESRLVPAGTPIPPPGTTVVDGRLRVCLSPEYSVTTPLWPLDEDSVVTRVLTDELLEQLRAWQSKFDASYRWDSGWQSDSAKSEWAVEAMHLDRALRRALYGRVDVTTDLWPLKAGLSKLEIEVEKWLIDDGQVPVPAPGLSVVGALELWCSEARLIANRSPSLTLIDEHDSHDQRRALYEVVGRVVTTLADAPFIDVGDMVVFAAGPEEAIPRSLTPGSTCRVVGNLCLSPEGLGSYWPEGRATIRSWEIDEVIEDRETTFVIDVH